jgi:hypothetical protein
MFDFIETRIVSAVRGILEKEVNEKLNNWNFFLPLFEFSDYHGSSVVNPVILLSSSEQSEKERIIKLDTYSMTITFSVPETPDSELICYAYSNAFCIVLNKNVTLGGVVDKAVVTNKKYVPPKKPNCGDDWELVITLRITVESDK